jgi:hypothetical protein
MLTNKRYELKNRGMSRERSQQWFEKKTLTAQGVYRVNLF